jgi:hypothetical protein
MSFDWRKGTGLYTKDWKRLLLESQIKERLEKKCRYFLKRDIVYSTIFATRILV